MSMNGTLVATKLGTAGSEAAVTGEVSNSQDFAFDLIETTVKASPGRSKTYETGENGATMSCEAKVKQSDGATIVAMLAAAKLGTAQSSIVTTGTVGDIEIEGMALFSGISVSNPQNDVRTITYSLTFTGEYTATVVPPVGP